MALRQLPSPCEPAAARAVADRPAASASDPRRQLPRDSTAAAARSGPRYRGDIDTVAGHFEAVIAESRLRVGGGIPRGEDTSPVQSRCLTILRMLPSGALTKNRRTPQGSVVIG